MSAIICYTEIYDSILKNDGSLDFGQVEKAEEEFRKIPIYLAKGDLVEIDPNESPMR